MADESYVRCRTYNHAWDEFNPIGLGAPSYGWRLSLRCMRCGTERHDNITFHTGQIMSRRYIYADGYVQHWGRDVERPTKEVFREELYEQLRMRLELNNALGADSEQTNVTPIRDAAKSVKRATAATTTRKGARKRA